ncbi:unnamed protein product [Amoebophrya sp. A25]|nr:unnamed protein product [Amoebophrya sp. A25]|eukprot:GSA25T00020389001.1
MGGGLKYTSAYLLSAMKGDEVTADSIKAIFTSGGLEFEQEMIDLVLKKMAGKTVQEIIAAGLPKLEACGGGGGGGGGAAAGGAAAGGDAAGAAEEKKEEKVEEEEDDMEFDLFD